MTESQWVKMLRDKYPDVKANKIVINDLYGKFERSFVYVELISDNVKVEIKIEGDQSEVTFRDTNGTILTSKVLDLDESQFKQLVLLCIYSATIDTIIGVIK